jgi:hypothetical protein
MHEYAEVRRLKYGEAIFIPVCTHCGRFVKADAQIRFRVVPGDWVDNVVPVEPNADCKKCGRVAMIWEGYE